MPVNSTPRISCRHDAPNDVKKLFTEIVASVDRTHWQTADSYLVESYCRAILLERQAYAMIELEGAIVGPRVSHWLTVAEKACKQIVALSMRLRLSPQSRNDPKTVGRRSRHAGERKPWEPDPQ
jgi:phage terminase small subunit